MEFLCLQFNRKEDLPRRTDVYFYFLTYWFVLQLNGNRRPYEEGPSVCEYYYKQLDFESV